MLLGVAALAATGCLDPGSQTAPAGLDQVQSPAYAYPERAPLVDRSSLGTLLTRLDSDYTVLWVLGEIGEETGATAAALSNERDALRAAGMSVVGLYAGPSSRWGPEVVPMLRSAGANFACAVIAPPGAAGLAAWLAGDPGRCAPGLYMVDRSQRVVARLDADPDKVAATIEDLASRRVPLSQPALLGGDTLLVRVRLIELTTGGVLVRATAEAADPAVLAADLGGQLVAAVRPAGTVAIVPIREVGPATAGTAGAGGSLGSLLTGELARRGWPRTVFPESTARTLATLGLTAMEVEFDPSRLADQVPWEAVLVGSIERRARPAG